jgi:hypothetical protein
VLVLCECLFFLLGVFVFAVRHFFVHIHHRIILYYYILNDYNITFCLLKNRLLIAVFFSGDHLSIQICRSDAEDDADER